MWRSLKVFVAIATVVLSVRADNTASGSNSGVGGGDNNLAGGSYSWVGGGNKNSAYGSYSAVLGGYSIYTYGYASSVGGGLNVYVYGSYTTISGGYYSYLYAPYGTVGGGAYHYNYGYAGTIGGGMNNLVSHFGAVAGGQYNSAYSYGGVIAGGQYNYVYGPWGSIGGGWYNFVYASSSVISGGLSNTAYDSYTAVGGGWSNTVFEYAAVISGGVQNKNYGYAGAIAGGNANYVGSDSSYGVVAGGYSNSALAYAVAMPGGYENAAYGDLSAIGGGSNNTVHGYAGLVAGGKDNQNYGYAGSIAGGFANYVGSLSFATVGGGNVNSARGYATVIAGGQRNSVNGSWGVVGGGRDNTLHRNGNSSVIAGGAVNVVDAPFSVVSGGSRNTVASGSDASAVGGGSLNAVNAPFASVAGGQGNNVRGASGAVGGGRRNNVDAAFGVIAGGSSNDNLGVASVVGGGFHNTAASSSYAVIGGGHFNYNNGSAATVAGGYGNFVAPSSSYASIGGGVDNSVRGNATVIGGGAGNFANSSWGVVGGGRNQYVNSPYGTIGGGHNNYVAGYGSTISGGTYVSVYGLWSTVAGGHDVHVSGVSSTVGGGQFQHVYRPISTIGGGDSNYIYGYGGTIAGGRNISVYGSYGTVAGGRNQYLYGVYGSIGGGGYNFNYGYAATVAGGRNNLVGTSYGTIGGGWSNSAYEYASVVSGGESNTAYGSCGTVSGGTRNRVYYPYGVVAGGSTNFNVGFGGVIAGGQSNYIYDSYGVVGGGRSNTAYGTDTVVAGGAYNRNYGERGVVGGGSYNAINAIAATVVGGDFNTAAGAWSSVGGGRNNSLLAATVSSSIGGGERNVVSAAFATVCGGSENAVAGNWSLVAGGNDNAALATYGVVGGGRRNTAFGYIAVVAGGSFNSVYSSWGVVGGGVYNIVNYPYAVIGGGMYDYNAGYGGTVAGGIKNSVYESYGVVGGGNYNTNYGYAGTIAGGRYNKVSGVNYGTVGGGYGNAAYTYAAVVAGGHVNRVYGAFGVVGGGNYNTVLAEGAVVGGGEYNVVGGAHGVIGGGDYNSVDAVFAVVGGGQENVATGNWSVVTGGTRNSALGTNSLAEGSGAVASHHAAAVLGFSATNSTCHSAGNSTITLCADNGVFVNGQLVPNAAEVAAIRADLAEHATLINESSVNIELLQWTVDANVSALHRGAALLESRIGDVANDTIVNSNNIRAISALANKSWANIELLQWTVDANVSALHSSATLLESRIDDVVNGITVINDNIRANSALANESSANIESLQRIAMTLDANVSAIHSNAAELEERIDFVASNTVAINSDIRAHAASINESSANIELLGRNMTHLADEIHDAHARISALDVNDTSSKMLALGDDVAALTSNATALAADVVHIANAVTRVNQSLVELESMDIAVLQSNVTKLLHSHSSIAEHTASIADLQMSAELLNNTVITQGSLMASNEATIASLESAAATQQLDLITLRRTVASLNVSTERQSVDMYELEVSLSRLNATVASQNSLLSAKDETIAGLQSQASEQQLEIGELKSTVNVMNASLTALSLIVEQMVRATSFAATTRDSATENVVTTVQRLAATDCVASSRGPCGAATSQAATFSSVASAAQSEVTFTAGYDSSMNGSINTTSTTTVTDTATPTWVGTTTTLPPLPVVTVQGCESYTCDYVADVFAWNSPIAVVATAEAAAVALFHFALFTDGGSVVWQQTTGTRFASFIPSDLDITSVQQYHLHVSVELDDGRSTAAISDTLRFAAPPTFHGVAVELVNSSAAANWFEIRVNATDATDLTFEYWVVDSDGAWQYLAGSSSSSVATVVVPSTQNVTLQVTVTNSFQSAESCTDCPTLPASSSWNVSIDDVLQDALRLVETGAAGSGVLLSALDVAENDNDVELVLAAFSNAMHANSTSLSEDVVVLNALVETSATTSGVMELVQSVGSRLTSDASSESLTLYLDTVGDYGTALVTQDDALDGVADMDEYLGTVCAANAAGGVPDGEVNVFAEDSYSLSCASSEDVVAVDAGAATVVAAVDGVSTVAVSTWNGTANMTNTSLLATIHGVHVEGGRTAGDALEVDAAMTLKLSLSSEAHAIRKAASCVYYDEKDGSWLGRGVVLRGMELDDAGGARVVCASSHLTLFTVGDSSEVARVVENKILSFADRVDNMNSVNFLDDGTAINWSILGVFLGSTVLFVIVIAIAKVKGRKVAVERGRLTFQQDGQLSKPNTMGSMEYEAVLRRWVSGADSAKLVVVELLTSNAVLGLLFHWDHEAVVFGRADKAVILFGAVLMTFVSSAFLFDPLETVHGDLLVALWSALVTAVLTNILLLPVQHFLPYMVSNVNSLTTMTRMPMTLLKREMKRRSCWKPTRRQRGAAQVQSQVLMHWLTLMGDGRGVPPQAWNKPAADDTVEHVSTQLHFLHCEVKLPSATATAKSFSTTHAAAQASGDSASTGIVRFQRLLRWRSKLKREVRNVEFHAWYVGLRRQRHTLAILSAAVLLTLAAFTLSICLLLSGTFNDDESLMWAGDVAQSLVVQIFVTDPTITLLVIFGKLFVSWALLRRGKQRLKRHLQGKEEAVEQQLATVSASVQVEQEKARALHVVATATRAVVEREKAKKTTAKKRCESALENIALERATISRQRQVVRRPQRIQVEKWDTDESVLNVRETTTRQSLQSIEAALTVLDTDRGSAREELRMAQETMAQLQRKLKSIAKAKMALCHELAKVEDKPAPAPKRTAVVPIVKRGKMRATTRDANDAGLFATAPALQVEEPNLERASMPAVQSAATSALNESSAPAPVFSGNRATRHTSSISRQATHTFRRRSRRGHPTSQLRTRQRGPMTWAEIRELQNSLKAKAAKEAAKRAIRRRPRRTAGSLGNLSPQAVKLMLERREHRRKLLEQRRRSQSLQANGHSADSFDL